MLTDEDYESVRRAGQALHQRGWRVFTLNEMVAAWASLVVEVENGYDKTFLHEFANDMACRTWLAEAWPMLTERVREARSDGGDDSRWWLSRSPRVVRT